jgi:hypothetical protein
VLLVKRLWARLVGFLQMVP